MTPISSQMPTRLRFGGMASGIDTEAMVQSLMRAERMRMTRLEQSRIRTEWMRDDFRGIHRLLKGLKDAHFDVLRPADFMLSANAYRAFDAQSSDGGRVSASALAAAAAGVTEIQQVDQLASGAVMLSARGVSAPLTGTQQMHAGADLTGKTLTLNLDGVSRTITFTQSYETGAMLIHDMQGLLDQAFGAGRIASDLTGDGSLRLDAGSSVLSVTSGTALDTVGFAAGAQNRIHLDASIAQAGLASPVAFGGDGRLSFSINGTEFAFEQTATLRQIMNTVNGSSARVRMTYSSLTDGFSLTAAETGSGRRIIIENGSGNLFGSGSVLALEAGYAENGQDALLRINGVSVARSANTFTLDGVRYTLNRTFAAAEGAVQVTVAQNSQAVVDRIKGFVENYNTLIDRVRGKLTEEAHRDFFPLTEEHKREMSEREIELWEEKARSGMLRGDRILEGVLREMRRALTEPVAGTSLSLSSIGVTTGSFHEHGKLHINEERLLQAVQQHGSQIEQLFAGAAEIRYSPNLSGAERQERYRTAGLMHRISDIVDDHIRTLRDSQGRKGILLEKAGIPGDLSEHRNLMSAEIQRINRRMDQLLDSLQRKEAAYWKQFTAMEKAMQQMNNQSMWLMQQTMSNQR